MVSFSACCEASYNKLFKRDSQRVAFSLCVSLSDQGGMQQLRYCVAHPLTGRYANKENI
ncbi:hypothetical protein B4946_18195 [Vibrio cholerae]|nr:hypothetical protein [Vibrio cholerae]